MLLLLLLLSASSCTDSQYLIKRMSHSPRMAIPRSAMETLEHLQNPRMSRYFPQVDTQVDPYSLYALPPQWKSEAEAVAFEPEYEYEVNPYDMQPSLADYAIPQDEMEPENNIYSDLMTSYLMRMPASEQLSESDFVPPLQRRSEEPRGDNAAAADKTGDNSLDSSPASTTAPQTQPQVQVTAVPTSPEKKSLISQVVLPPATPAKNPEGGQKEEPLFRPFQSSQRTVWSEETRHRKSPIPLLKQIMQKTPSQADPLAEELNNLKKSV